MQDFITQLEQSPDSIEFSQTMAVIEKNYVFTPVEFKNGDLLNQAGENSGSCKIFAFGLLQELSVEQTLFCFGEYYRDDVLKNPEATDHMNIRNFMKHGWAGIHFSAPALVKS